MDPNQISTWLNLLHFLFFNNAYGNKNTHADTPHNDEIWEHGACRTSREVSLDPVLLKGTILANPSVIGAVHHYMQVIIIEARVPKQNKNNTVMTF